MGFHQILSSIEISISLSNHFHLLDLYTVNTYNLCVTFPCTKYSQMLNSRGVARANQSICIISARGQEATQGPQWGSRQSPSRGSRGANSPGLLDFSRFTYFRTCLCECVLFCLQFTICVLRSGRMCRRWIQKTHIENKT